MNTFEKLKTVETLSDQDRTYQFVDTGIYALNYVISGKYNGGVPIPGITQFIGDSSTGKSAFATTVIANAQKQGFHCLYEDAENTLSNEFANVLGIDSNTLLFNTPESIEETFEHMEKVVKEIRTHDPTTPIVIVVDSLAVLCAKKELEGDTYDQSPVDGALRAKILGSCMRKFDKVVKKYNVGLVVINQHRSKINVMYGDPTTAAAGGRSLDYYLSVNLKTKSNKSSMIEENGKIVGISGEIINLKNKVSIPFKECEFRLLFNTGFSKYEGLLPSLEDNGIVTKSGAWYTGPEGVKFQKGSFLELLDTDLKMNSIRALLGMAKIIGDVTNVN